MKNMVFYILLLIVCFFFLADTKITFNPFSFKIQAVSYAIGWILIVIGGGFIFHNGNLKGFERGYSEGYKNSDFFKGYEKGVEDMSNSFREDLQKAVIKINQEKNNKNKKE